ncbi:MAG: hypothetical protein COT35_01225 [Nitrospirae bacterium CG08_land_8_20_14_0_20_52_24]|nr:MAG: hypothetical protein COT35_01225 [Nitrospirae bacterium CG08_land_8_20_14_0_20_52_24]
MPSRLDDPKVRPAALRRYPIPPHLQESPVFPSPESGCGRHGHPAVNRKSRSRNIPGASPVTPRFARPGSRSQSGEGWGALG